MREVSNSKDYRFTDTLNAIFSFTPPKGSAGTVKPFNFNLKAKDAKFGFGLFFFNRPLS